MDASIPDLNHRTLAILVLAVGFAGCFLELMGPPPMIVPRLVLFAGVLVAGVFYLVRVVRRSRRTRLGIKALARSRVP